MKHHDRKSKLIIPLSIFILLVNLYANDTECVWTDVEKIIAVGDLHGDYENFLKILKHTKVTDENLHWIAGKTHLVQIGDIMDRGKHAKKIFDLIMRLEKEAEDAGGRVHMLIGNHEELNITGISLDRRDYVTAQQFVDFIPDDYREKQEKKFRKKMKANSPEDANSNSLTGLNMIDSWEVFFNEEMKKGSNSTKRKYMLGLNQKYGKWILDHNAVIKINDIIFVHGGISPRFSTKKLKNINDRLRIELEDYRRSIIFSRRLQISEDEQQIVYNPEGPLWFRDLATKPEDNYLETLDTILKNLGAKSIVCAHTPIIMKSSEQMKRFGGKVWIIDTAISDAYPNGSLSALIIEDYGNKFSPWLEEREGKSIPSEQRIEHQLTHLGAGGKNGDQQIFVLIMIKKKNFYTGG